MKTIRTPEDRFDHLPGYDFEANYTEVDGMRVPLWTRLKNGQSVEIITAEGQRPQATWIDIVATGRAKAAIRRALKSTVKD